MKLLIIFAMCATVTAQAMEYDVDMPNSGDPNIQLIRVTIDKCETKFKIKTKEFEAFSKNPDAMTQLVKKAIEHKTSGCGN